MCFIILPYIFTIWCALQLLNVDNPVLTGSVKVNYWKVNLQKKKSLWSLVNYAAVIPY